MSGQLKSDHLYYGIIGLAMIAPLVFFPSLINLYRLPKTVFITLLVTALVWLWLFLLIQEKDHKAKFPLAVPIALYFAISLLSLIKSANPSEGIFALSQEAIYIFLFWLAANHVRATKQIETILLWMIPSAVIVSLIGIYQAFGGDIPGLVMTGGIGSTFGNKSPAAQYILLTLPFPYLFLLSATEKDRQRLFAVCAAITTTYLFYTGARASWIGGLAAVLAIFIFLRAKRDRLQPHTAHLTAQIRDRKSLLIFIILFVVVMNLIPPFLAQNWSAGGALPRLATGLELERDTSFMERAGMWANTLGMFKDHPFLGVGKGNFKILYPRYATYATSTEDSAFSPEVQPREAHNDYVQFLAETGIIGLVSFLVIIFFIGVKLWKSLGENNDPTSLATLLGLSFAVIALLVNAFLDFPFEHPVSTGFFWLFAGLLWVSCENAYAMGSHKITGRWTLSPRLGRILLGSLSALAILFAAYYVNLLRAEFYGSRGTIWFYEKREGPWQPAANDLKEAEYLNPYTYRYPYTLGLLDIWLGKYDDAIQANLRALKQHPYYINAYNNLGVAFASMGKLKEAEWAWNKALEIWPDHSQARDNLATVYAMHGKRREAIALFKISLIRDPQDENARQKLKQLLGQTGHSPKVKS